jgi:hypothetical protein
VTAFLYARRGQPLPPQCGSTSGSLRQLQAGHGPQEQSAMERFLRFVKSSLIATAWLLRKVLLYQMLCFGTAQFTRQKIGAGPIRSLIGLHVARQLFGCWLIHILQMPEEHGG